MVGDHAGDAGCQLIVVGEPGTHAGILVLRLDDHSLPGVRAALEGLLADVALVELAGCVAVFRNGDLRIRRPPTA